MLCTLFQSNLTVQHTTEQVVRDRNGKNLWRGSTKRRVPQR